MKKNFKYKNGEIKVIWNEIPMHKDYEETYFRETIEQKTNLIITPFSVGVELKKNSGGRIIYGMLMAHIEPRKEKNIIKISIAYTKKNTIRYEDSFLWNDALVFKGLQEEYVANVYSSICKTINRKEDYPQCDICFDYAANCEVGSSPMIFGIIAEMIIEIIYANSVEEIFRMSIEEFTQKYVRNINLCY